MTVYKVVTERHTGFYESAIWHCHPLRYEVGEWTYPKIGKIFVFCDVYHALDFASLSCQNIFRAEAINARLIKEAVNVFRDEYFEPYWQGKDLTIPLREVPRGTLICDALKPIKLIRKYDRLQGCS